MSKNQVQDGKVLTFTDSQLVKPSHTDGFTHHDDPVLVGRIVGVALNSAAASTDNVDVSMDGVFNLSVSPIHNGLSVGETVYINPTTAVLSDDQNGLPFGHAVTAAPGNVTATIAVRLMGPTPGATGANS